LPFSCYLLQLSHLVSISIIAFRLGRRHPEDVFRVFWPHLTRFFSRCYGHLPSGDEVNVFTEVVPRAGRRNRADHPAVQEAAASPPSSLLERRLACRPDLDADILWSVRERLVLSLPPRQVRLEIIKTFSLGYLYICIIAYIYRSVGRTGVGKALARIGRVAPVSPTPLLPAPRPRCFVCERHLSSR
jgi:hypothetical protein